MNYPAKMRVHTLLHTLLGKYKSKPEVKLWLMWKFIYNCKIKKRKIVTYMIFYLKQIVEP